MAHRAVRAVAVRPCDTGGMTQVASITLEETRFEDRFLQILEATGLEPEEFEGLPYFSYCPFFVIAGATVSPRIREHGDHSHFEGVSIDVPDDQTDIFYDVLPDLLAQIQPLDEDEDETA
jgi:hypothetical protein